MCGRHDVLTIGEGFAVDRLSVSFAFGSVLGAVSEDLSLLCELFGDRCSLASRHLSGIRTSAEGYGWLSLPDYPLEDVKSAGEWLASYDSIIHVGIGGSALGNLMLNQACFGSFVNDGGVRPNFYLADNPDPSKTAEIWTRAKNGRVALVGVSKSGATAETMSQFLWFREQMAADGRECDADTLVVTDPKNGLFRAFADETGCRALELPSSVGGRYSVLSSAALAEAYAMGIDIDALLYGARLMRKIVAEDSDFFSNPAKLMSAANCFHAERGRNMSVLMPYSCSLEYFAEWYAQLWGESLGKEGRGTAPIRALGAIDQHSQVQLYAEGPDDKFYTIINIKNRGCIVKVPHTASAALAPLEYMAGKDIGDMLSLEAMSTAAALAKAGRPIVWIEAERLDEKMLGGLIFFYEYMTAMTGILMGINPFDQPGVEQGKRYTYGLMGKDGYKKDADEAAFFFGGIKRQTLVI